MVEANAIRPSHNVLGTVLARLCPPCARAREARRSIPRIAARELCARLGSGREIRIYDVRHPLDLLGDSRVLPRTIRARPQDLAHGELDLAKGAEIVVYCAMESEAASEHAARNLKKRGYSNVRVLAGGFRGWKKAGLPLISYDVRNERGLEGEAVRCRRGPFTESAQSTTA